MKIRQSQAIIKHSGIEGGTLVINQQTGRLRGSTTKVSDLIEYLQGHKKVYGDTLVRFEIHGESVEEVQFEHFNDAIIIDVKEDLEY